MPGVRALPGRYIGSALIYIVGAVTALFGLRYGTFFGHLIDVWDVQSVAACRNAPPMAVMFGGTLFMIMTTQVTLKVMFPDLYPTDPTPSRSILTPLLMSAVKSAFEAWRAFERRIDSEIGEKE